MKARIPKHREFIISFPDESNQARNDEAWDKPVSYTHLCRPLSPTGRGAPVPKKAS